jgi:ABC-type multidrug transport system permease subunit
MKIEGVRRMGHLAGIFGGLIWLFGASYLYPSTDPGEFFVAAIFYVPLSYTIGWSVVRALEWVYLGFVEST